jgi:hypothetical protein
MRFRGMRKFAVAAVVAGVVLPMGVALGGPFVGKFSDGKLTADLADAQGGYSGTISLGEQNFPATAAENGQGIAGTFVAGENRFAFKGTLDGDVLTLVTGSKAYTLKKEAEAVNPLAGGGAAGGQVAPVNPLAAGPGVSSSANSEAGTLPAGYSVVQTTDAGRAMAAHKGDATAVMMALQETMVDLVHYFDGRPTIVKAYEDTADQSSGGVSFTAMLKGQAVAGLASAKLVAGNGAAVAVLYCNANATAADWAKLMARGGGGAAGGGAAVALQTYQFPDNSGSIGLAQGWTTNAQSCNGLVLIAGPGDQVITLNFGAEVVTPDSNAVRMNQALNANAQQMGAPPIPLGLLVSAYGDPVEVLNSLTPQLSERSEQSGGPGLALDHLVEVKKVAAMMPGGTGAIARYGVTLNDKGEQKHRQVAARVEVDPIGNGTFSFFFSSAASPDATYQNDLPTMLAIVNSLRANGAVIAAQTQQHIQGMNAWFAQQQKSEQELLGTYDDYNKDIAKNELITERSNTDFDEVVQGVRDVEDTETGYKSSVNLGDVDQVVNTLNEGQPGRFKEIPLRDEMFPLPGN